MTCTPTSIVLVFLPATTCDSSFSTSVCNSSILLLVFFSFISNSSLFSLNSVSNCCSPSCFVFHCSKEMCKASWELAILVVLPMKIKQIKRENGNITLVWCFFCLFLLLVWLHLLISFICYYSIFQLIIRLKEHTLHTHKCDAFSRTEGSKSKPASNIGIASRNSRDVPRMFSTIKIIVSSNSFMASSVSSSFRNTKTNQ